MKLRWENIVLMKSFLNPSSVRCLTMRLFLSRASGMDLVYQEVCRVYWSLVGKCLNPIKLALEGVHELAYEVVS